MNLLTRLRQGQTEQRYSFDEYVSQVSGYLGGFNYTPQQTYDKKPVEPPMVGFEGRVQGAYKHNGVVFACQVARLLLFTEARFMWQQLRAGRPGDRFWTPDLLILEQPWIDGATGDLLGRMIQDADLAGNAFIRRTGPTSDPALERLRPDWTSIALGSTDGLVTPQVVGYFYQPGGPGSDKDPVFFDRSEVAHWSPIPDPITTYRGMSPLTSALRDVRSDSAATDHKLQFWDHAATPNMKVKFDIATSPEKAEKFKELLEGEHRGLANAYKTLYLGGGADAEAIGLDFKQMDFKEVQGANETRIAAAFGVPPVIVGLSEGLQAATYSNYAQARRRFADMTIRPLWRSACAALTAIVTPPDRARLYYDDRDIPALQEDEKDAADIESVKATTIATLVRDGFEPGSVVAAVMAQDMTLLTHTGRVSVQLLDPNQPPAPNTQDVPA